MLVRKMNFMIETYDHRMKKYYDSMIDDSLGNFIEKIAWFDIWWSLIGNCVNCNKIKYKFFYQKVKFKCMN